MPDFSGMTIEISRIFTQNAQFLRIKLGKIGDFQQNTPKQHSRLVEK
jgi:hypothetical protein